MENDKKRPRGEEEEQEGNKRARILEDEAGGDAIERLRDILDRRVSYKQRVQGQVAMQDGPTGLGVLYAETGGGHACTYLIEPWIHLISHPVHGLEGYRLSMKAYTSIPFFVSKKLWRRPRYDEPAIYLEVLINRWISTSPDELSEEERTFFLRWRDEYELPTCKECHVKIEIRHVEAKKGDIVLYRTFHCNASTKDVACVHHLDYVPYEPTEENLALFRQVYEQRKKKSHSVGQGSGNKPTIENEYYEECGVNGEPLPMPTHPVARAALGRDSWEGVYKSTFNPFSAIIPSDKKRLETAGHLVITPREYYRNYEQWYTLVDEALEEFEDFFNYALFGRLGIEDKRLSFDNRRDPLWTILRGEAECLKLLGDRKFLNIAKKDKGEWRHAGTAQGGQSNVTKMCGMGAATNFYRGAASLKLSSHFFVASIFQCLYGTVHVHNCCERWRVKAGTGIIRDNEFPRSNVMPFHSDTRPPSFSHGILDNA